MQKSKFIKSGPCHSGTRSFKPNNSRKSYGGKNQRGGGRRQAPGKKYINPSLFINQAVAPEMDTPYQPTHSFADFGFDQRIETTLAHAGYNAPSAIQDQSIQAIIDGKDLLGLANTGTGKTAAFLLPVINKLITTNARDSVLIVTPTRELAQQIDDEFKKFAYGLNLYSAVLVGGSNIGRQISSLKRHPHVVIGTPGRLGDLIGRRLLKLENIDTFILDEVDRMLDMGFVVEIKKLAAQLVQAHQTLAFSATITPAVQTILSTLLQPDFETVSVVTRQTNEHIDQNVIHAGDKLDKIEKLKNLLSEEAFEKVLIFGETKYGVQRLADHLNASEFSATAIHGNKSQSQRQRSLDDFKRDKVNILVATDVAARGLDIPNVSHVINFDTPQTYDDYIHRIGRTGRAGKPGKALTFVDKK